MQLLSKSLKIYNIKLIDTASDNLKTVEMEDDIKALIMSFQTKLVLKVTL